MKKNKAAQERRRRSGGRYYDYNLLACLILLLSFGLIMLYSASAYEAYLSSKIESNLYFFRHQLRNAVLAVVWAVFLSKIPYRLMAKFAGFLYVLSFVLMALVRTPLGVEELGARRWLNLGIQFQPSEVAKISVILFLPLVILKMGKNYKQKKGQILVLCIGGVQALGAFVLTENLSTGIIILLITLVIWIVSCPKQGWDVRVGIIILAIAGAMALLYLKDHLELLEGQDGDFRWRRIYEWLSGGSYQIHQGLYAIGSGGFFGKGLGNSAQKLGTIPEAQNDMIFSIICEELGVFGGVLLMMMFGYLLYRLFMIAQNAPDMYGTLVVSGIFGHIAVQVILNIMVVFNMIPTTGITLPFISYGGTSLLFLMTELGVALSVANSIRFKEKRQPEDDDKNLLTNA